MSPFRPLLAAGGLVALCAAQAVQAAPTYHIVDLGDNEVAGINNAGTVAGAQYCSKGSCGRYKRAAIFRAGAWHKLDTGTELFGIDDAGDTVGDAESTGLGYYWARGQHSAAVTMPYATAQVLPYGVGDGQVVVGAAAGAQYDEVHCFRWHDGVAENLTPDLTACYAYAINHHGWITGEVRFDPRSFTRTAFVWHDGQFTNLGDFGGPAGSAGLAINRTGHVVGTASAPGVGITHAFFYDGAMHDLGTLPGALGSSAAGLNAQDEVVGSSLSSTYEPRATLYTGGALLDLNTLVDDPVDWVLKFGRAINDSGTIVGLGTYQGQRHSFMAVRTSD